MPRPTYRSRHRRIVKRRTPGGKSVVHYERKKHDVPRCAICGKPLHGKSAYKSSDSKKGKQRKYYGYICASCYRKIILKELTKFTM